VKADLDSTGSETVLLKFPFDLPSRLQLDDTQGQGCHWVPYSSSLQTVSPRWLPLYQGCQMVYFQTKNPNLGKFWSALQWNMLVNFIAIHMYFTAVWYILWPFWSIFPVLVCCTKKNLATMPLYPF
jgi:hypothetical protein